MSTEIEFLRDALALRDRPSPILKGIEGLNKNLDRIASALEQLVAQKASLVEGSDFESEVVEPLDEG